MDSYDREKYVYQIDHDTGECMDIIRVPCGKCVGCRLDYAREWSSRIVMESFDYPTNSLFLTLTYDDEHLPCNFADGSDKVVHGIEQARYYGDVNGATLHKKDTQDFFKRLRYNISYNWPDHKMKLRYYLAGEYGPKTHRPHYHVCLFGCPDDLEPVAKNELGHTLYDSALLRETWGNGNIVVGELNPQTAGYTARYTLKKAQGEDHAGNDALGIAREFVTMSRKPGLGVNYYERNKERIYENDEIILPAVSKDKKNVVKPPRYFDILYQSEDAKDYARIKAQRGVCAELAHQNTLKECEERQLDEIAYLTIKENQKKSKIKSLVRDIG